MSRDWKPGDVAMVTFKAPSHGGFFGSDHAPVVPGEFVAVAAPAAHGEGGVVWHSSGGGAGHASRRDVIGSVRPLVVIDPEELFLPGERAPAEGALEALESCLRHLADTEPTTHRGNVARRLAAALRSLIAPPRPEEPTESSARAVTDGATQHWARILTDRGPRWVTDGGVGITWDELVTDHPDVEVQR